MSIWDAPDIHSITIEDHCVPVDVDPHDIARLIQVRAEVCAITDYNDDGLALEVVRVAGDRIRYATGIGWLRWDGVRWVPDSAEYVREIVKAVARTIDDSIPAAKRFRGYALSAGGTTNALKQAQSDTQLRIIADQLDAHPMLINTPSGVLDLASGQVLNHDPALLLTRTTAVTVNHDPPTRWLRFLAETFTDPALIAYMQLLGGLALIGQVREHLLPFLHGAGSNGKSVLSEVWQAVLGNAESGGYALAASEGLLSAGQERHPTEVARLRGARLVVAAEQTGTKAFAEARVKQFTGGDQITGRFMRQDLFTFEPSHLLIVVGNNLPPVKVGGPSFWRRVRVIPFANVVPEGKRDVNLARTIIATEGPAVLAWMAEGARLYLQSGFTEPTVVKAASLEYEQSEDPLRTWVDDALDMTRNPGDGLTGAELHSRYSQWCADHGLEPIGQRTLTSRITAEFGLESKMIGTRRIRGLAGIAWRQHDRAEKERSERSFPIPPYTRAPVYRRDTEKSAPNAHPVESDSLTDLVPCRLCGGARYPSDELADSDLCSECVNVTRPSGPDSLIAAVFEIDQEVAS